MHLTGTKNKLIAITRFGVAMTFEDLNLRLILQAKLIDEVSDLFDQDIFSWI